MLAAVAMAGNGSKASVITCRTGPGCLNGTDAFDWMKNYGPPPNSIPNNSTAISNSGAIMASLTFAGGGSGERVNQGDG